jgi:ketosteroid isomerase-like protein
MPTPAEPRSALDTLRRYFESCNRGDVALMRSTLTDDVVHYFVKPGFAPLCGADALVAHWEKFHRNGKPVWALDRTLGQGDDIVAEWSCLWTPKGQPAAVMMRGVDWYVLRGGRICEVRAYYATDAKGASELTGFPYAERGYLTVDLAPSPTPSRTPNTALGPA